MAGPTPKRQKLDDNISWERIIFNVPDMKPDMRIMVFEQEFHVHSTLLKFHSAFFRKFLDSPEKTRNPRDGFQYSWMTKVDEDGQDWALVSAGEEYASVSKRTLRSKNTKPEITFGALLRAIYNRSYIIGNFGAFEQMVRLADYYLCLPVLSRTVTAAILSNTDKITWYQGFERNCITALQLSFKIRNAALFRDALIFVNSDWLEPCYTSIEDEFLRNVADKAYQGIALNIARLHSKILMAQAVGCTHRGHYVWGSTFTDLCTRLSRHALLASFEEDDRMHEATYFRSIANETEIMNSHEIRPGLEDLLSCKLLFNTDRVAGNDDYPDRFFCATIDDDDLPWDTSEVDW